MCVDYTQILWYFITDLSIYRFWYPQRVLEPVCPAGTKGQLHTHTHAHAHTHTHSHTQMEYHSATHNKRTLSIGENMDGPWEHYAKWNKSDRDRQYMLSHLIMWNLKNKTNNFLKTKFMVQRTDWWLPEAGCKIGEMGERSQRYKFSIIE